MLVPRDHLLAARAREWACSPFATLRLNALIALAQMPSAQSQEMLRQMLATEDDFAWRHPSRWGPRTYPAREHIQRVLREWNAPFDSRTEVEPRVAYAPIRWPWVFGLLIAIAAPLLWRRLRRPATVVLKDYVWVIALLLLAAMWMRSLWFADEFIFNIGRSEHELVSCHGGVQYVWTADWPHRERWRIGSGRLRPDFSSEVHEAERAVFVRTEFTPWEPRTLARPWTLVTRSNSSVAASVPVAAANPLLQRWGFAFARGDRLHELLSVDGSPPAQPTASPPPSSTARLIQVPYWMLMSVAGIPLGIRLVAWRRRHHRRQRGLCPQCGYDLRASPARCPECGSNVGRG
jgi:hypothetical protein